MKDGKMTAFGIFGVLLMTGTIALLPGIHGAPHSGSSLTGVVTPTSTTTALSTQDDGMVSSPACSGLSEVFGNMTFSVSPCGAYGFPSAFVRNATLDTRQVLPFIKTAYEYHLVYFAHNAASTDVMCAVLNVTGSQVVDGNYTTGYQVSYVGNKLLNVTFLEVTPQHFDVMHVSAYTLPDRNESVAYTPRDIEAVGLALSDPKVTSLMAGAPYYAEFVGSSGNATTSGRYLVQFYQVDGTRVVGAFVNLDLNSVVSSYSQQRGFGECWPGGIVITDPWGETGFGCTG